MSSSPREKERFQRPTSRRKRPQPTRIRFQLRCSVLVILHLLLCVPLVIVSLAVVYGGIPPHYSDARRQERALTQHDRSSRARCLNATTPCAGPKYLRFADHLDGHGFNNILEESILAYHLAHSNNRTYVFEDYIWSRLPLPYTLYDFTLRPTRIPLGALLGGVLPGGSEIRRDDEHPTSTRTSISAKYFEYVCPPGKQVELEYRWPANEDGSSHPRHEASAKEIFEWWSDRLGRPDVLDARCVVVRETERRIFDFEFFGSTRILEVLPTLFESPVLQGFRWSETVQDAADRIAQRLLGGEVENRSRVKDAYSNSSVYLPGVLVVHVRRGDFKRHCIRLLERNARYLGLNRMEGMVDTFNPGPHRDSSRNKEAYYLSHCLPSISQIVQKLRNVRQENRTLNRVYIMTNGWPSFVDELRRRLLQDGWDAVFATTDMDNEELTREQRGVAVAIDMALAERAEVFVGNGFSSLSANILMLRVARGFPINSNRLL